MNRVNQFRDDLQRILSKCWQALDAPETEMSRDAAILRFELAFEVGWKLLQVLVRDQGYEAKSKQSAKYLNR